MAIPHVLPTPPIIVQDPARCWAAAYDGFSQATAANLGIFPGSGDDLVRWFESGSGLVSQAGAPPTAAYG